MQIYLPSRPLQLTVELPWRELYAGGAFGQRELASDGAFRSAAQERGMQLGIGRETLERLDLDGAFSPIAFTAGYFSGFEVPAAPVESMQFREELAPTAWEAYEWEFHGSKEVTPLYCPWQLLYLDDVLRETGAQLALDTMLLPVEQRDRQLELLLDWFEGQQGVLRSLHASWTTTMKVLVALQNRYLPILTGSESVIGVPGGGWAFAGREWADQPPETLLELLGCTIEEITGVYHLLVERGLSRDPNDGLTLLRRAQLRAFHKRWRGEVRRAQDNFDAAQVLWLFLDELGARPGRPSALPMDGRQPDREALFDRGPASPWSDEELKDWLVGANLYPAAIYVLCEGASEEIIIERLTEAVFGRGAVRQLRFHDLGGSGSAKHVAPLLSSLSEAGRHAVAIVDREGRMAEYLETAIEDGAIAKDAVLLCKESIEADNARAELISLAQQVAAHPPPGREPVSFELEADELERYHAERCEASPRNGTPGLADSLIRLVRRKTQGRLEIDKLELVGAVASMLAEELTEQSGPGTDAVAARRPVVNFFLERIAPELMRALPVGHTI